MALEDIVGKIEGDPKGFLSAMDKAIAAIRDFDDRIDKSQKNSQKSFDKPRDALGRFTKGAGRATSALGDLSLGFAGAGGAAVLLAKRLTNLAGDALAAVVDGVVTLTRESIALNREIGRATAEVSTLVDTSIVNVDELADKAREVTRVFGIDAVDATKALYQTLSASVEPSKALDVLKASALGAQGGLAGLEDTVNLTTSVINAYGKAAEDAERIQDVLFTAVKRGKTTIEELNGTIGQVIPTAAIAGVSFEEVASAVATLTRNGLNSRMAAVSLNQAIASFLKPSRQARGAAADLGIAFNGQNLAAKGLLGSFREITAALEIQKSRGEDYRKTLNELFGNIRAFRAAAILAEDQGLKGFAADLEAAANSSGVAAEAAGKLAGTLDAKLKLAYAELQAGLLAAGQPLAEFVSELIDAQGGAVALAEKIRGAGAAVKEFVSDSIKGFGGAAKAVNELGDAVSNLSGPLSLVATSIKIIGNTGVGALSLATFTASALAGRLTSLASFALGAADSLVSALEKLASVASTVTGGALGEDLQKSLAESRASLDEQIKSLDKLEKSFDKATQKSADLFKGSLKGILKNIEGFGDLSDSIDDLGKSLSEASREYERLNLAAAISAAAVPSVAATAGSDLLGTGFTPATGGQAFGPDPQPTPPKPPRSFDLESLIFGGFFGDIASTVAANLPSNNAFLTFQADLDAAAEKAKNLGEETEKTETLRTEVVREAAEKRIMAERLAGQKIESAAATSGFRAAEALRSGFTAAESRLYEAARSFGGKAGFSFISAAAAGITEGFTREFKGPLGARAALEAQRASDNFLRGQFGFSSGNFGLPSGQTAIRVLGFSNGGFVPGVGRGDKVPAMLEPGEYVVSNDELDAGLGGGVVIENLVVNGGGDRRDARQFAKWLAEEMDRELQRRRRLGQGGRR